MTKVRRSAVRRDRRGAMLVLIAICLPIMIIMAAFAVDVAWMQLSRAELRTATDAAARAGAKRLSLSQNITTARNEAKSAAKRNIVSGKPLSLVNADIQVGKSTQTGTSRFVFTDGGAKPNAVRVTGKKTAGSTSGPVDLLFSNIMGVDIFEPIERATSSQLDRDICLVVDRSGSMMWVLTGSSQYPKGTKECDKPHPTLSRWGALNSAVNVFLSELASTVQDERVALASYSSNTTECGNKYKISTLDSDLVSDYSEITDEMNRISRKPVKGNTAISAGIDEGVKVLTGKKTRPFAVKTMIVMTDGIHNQGREPALAAKDAAAQDITIHTITFGADADVKRMKDVAAATGGKHFHADDPDELINVFREIAATLPVLTTE